jgi:hypothetical protein
MVNWIDNMFWADLIKIRAVPEICMRLGLIFDTPPRPNKIPTATVSHIKNNAIIQY